MAVIAFDLRLIGEAALALFFTSHLLCAPSLFLLLPRAPAPLFLAPKLLPFSLATTAMAPKRKASASDAPATDAAALKGKKTATSASAAAVDLKKSDGDWMKSTIKAAHLEKFREDGLLPPAD